VSTSDKPSAYSKSWETVLEGCKPEKFEKRTMEFLEFELALTAVLPFLELSSFQRILYIQSCLLGGALKWSNMFFTSKEDEMRGLLNPFRFYLMLKN
jgi:hypothetical protein